MALQAFSSGDVPGCAPHLASSGSSHEAVASHAPGLGLTVAQVIYRCGRQNLVGAYTKRGPRGVLEELSLHGSSSLGA